MKWISLAILLWGVFTCSDDASKQIPATQEMQNIGVDIRRAQGFWIDSIPGFRILHLHNPWKGVPLRWVLTDDARSCRDCILPDSLISLPRLHLPLQRVVVMSTTHLALLEELQVLDRVVGVGRLDFVQLPLVLQRMKEGKVVEVGYGPSIQVEKVLELSPEAVITFGVGDEKMDDYGQLQKAHIPAIVFSEWMEAHPLARLEWIRLAGVLFGKSRLADSIYVDRVQRYDSLRTLVPKTARRPTVLTGFPQGETWHLTGGRNYFARFLEDAHADYLWKEDSSSAGFSLTLEQVLIHAGEADFWFNPGIWAQRALTEQSEPRVKLFQAWNKKQVFQHDKGSDKAGSSRFWELGMVRPDLVLADLVHVFHPGTLPGYQTTFYHPLP